MNIQLPVLALYIFLLGSIGTDNIKNPYSDRFEPAVKTGTIHDINLYEASGLIASRTNKGMFWVINDSGNDARLFLIDANGKTIHYYWIDNATNFDWEDLAICSDETGKSKLYIGDIGDNNAIRKNINIIVLDEPVFKDPNDTIITDYKNYLFSYPDGAKDAESIMADPINSTLYIITKREKNVRIYEAPKAFSQSDSVKLVFKHTLPFYNVTSGDISANGREVLLKNYNAIFYWKRGEHESIVEAMVREHELIRYNPEPQGESIAWSVDNDGFWTLSEKRGLGDQVLYFYERK